MSSSVHFDNKGKDIVSLGEVPTQRLNYTVAAEAKYPINFIQSGKRFVSRQHYNGINSFFFVNATKDFTINNMKKKTRLKLVGKFLSVDFNPIETNNIIGMHK